MVYEGYPQGHGKAARPDHIEPVICSDVVMEGCSGSSDGAYSSDYVCSGGGSGGAYTGTDLQSFLLISADI